MDKVLSEPLVEALSKALRANKSSLEVLTTLDIMKQCLHGYSNKYISMSLNIPLVDVTEVLQSTLGHIGWDEDLGFSPLAVFKEICNEYPSYSLFLSSMVHYIQTTTPPLELLYHLCYRYSIIEDFLERSVQ